MTTPSDPPSYDVENLAANVASVATWFAHTPAVKEILLDASQRLMDLEMAIGWLVNEQVVHLADYGDVVMTEHLALPAPPGIFATLKGEHLYGE